ncbi:MAG: hypothetical protein J6V53_04885, partial [Alphaproteobacteria bacterium]|nr:hypothetical protein [Alphaproteobacteria bacterium]
LYFEKQTYAPHHLSPTQLQTPVDTAVFPANSSSDFALPLSQEELDAEALKVEKFINSLTDEEFVENPVDTEEKN